MRALENVIKAIRIGVVLKSDKGASFEFLVPPKVTKGPASNFLSHGLAFRSSFILPTASLKQKGPHDCAGLFARSWHAREDESRHWVEVVPVI